MSLPYKIHRPTEAVMLALLASNCIASYFFYQGFPERVPTHWNFAGEIDGWSGPGFAAFFFPAMIIGLYLLLTFIPLADPNRNRYEEFGRPYGVLRLSFVLFMSLIYFIISFAGLGFDVNVGLIIPFGVGILFVILGNFMPKFKKNWFVGIRTPWTMADERVWTQTHRMGGRLFVIGGVLMMLSAVTPPIVNLILLIAVVGLLTFGTIGYSYWIWRKLQPSTPSDK
ncbi:MAG: SdpI family protein [Patescibacteria group bacterium]